jgi:hypothetical protein
MSPKKASNEEIKSAKNFFPSTGFWPTKSGTGHSAYITEDVLKIMSNVKFGGRLFLQPLEDSGNERAPSYRLVIMPPSEDQEQSKGL